MISTSPGSDGHAVLQVLAAMDEPTGHEISQNAHVPAPRVPRVLAELRRLGLVTGLEYRIAHPDLLARRGLLAYVGLVADSCSMRPARPEDLETRIVEVVARGPISRSALAAALGCQPTDGGFGRALASVDGREITNHPALTEAGRTVARRLT